MIQSVFCAPGNSIIVIGGGRHWESSLVQAIITFEVGFEQSAAMLFCCQIQSHLREELRFRLSGMRAYTPALCVPRPLKLLASLCFTLKFPIPS